MSSTGLPLKPTPTPTSVPVSTSTNSLDIISLFFTVGGIITVIIGIGMQLAVINNGPSGDNIIMSNMRTYGATLATGFVCIVIGLVLWRVLTQSSKAFIWLFIITMISYILSNFAIMLSLQQVNLVKQ